MNFYNFPRNFLHLIGLVTAGFLSAKTIPLTTDGSNKRDPVFIDGGATLVYGVDEHRDLIRLWQIDLETLEAKPYYESANRHHVEVAFSGDGRYVSYTECTGNLTAQFVIKDLQEKKDYFVKHSGRGGTRSPAFAPDNSVVVYAFAEKGPQQLWSVDMEAKNKKQLTQCEGISNWPSFTPDGKTIIFSNTRENNYEIYSMDADGANEKRLTENTIMDIRPVVSPDGKQIAFTSLRNGFYNVYVMNIDGSNVRRVTDSEERDDYPSWHPDGRRLAIVSERKGKFDLYMVEVPSSGKITAKR
jgi:Tol biopolymer transport system component